MRKVHATASTNNDPYSILNPHDRKGEISTMALLNTVMNIVSTQSSGGRGAERAKTSYLREPLDTATRLRDQLRNHHRNTKIDCTTILKRQQIVVQPHFYGT
jgi:hypothetical protein